MNDKQFVVRIVNPSPKPHIPEVKLALPVRPNGQPPLLSKAFNIFFGSLIGLTSGVAIFLMLKLVGINFGGLESTLVIGFPSALGLITSLVVF